MHEMAHLFIFGLGYTSRCIATAAKSQGWTISATGSSGDVNFADEAGMMAQIAHADYILSSVPPADGGDPVLSSYGAALSGKRIGYLSSTGVYGDTGGAWVDEAAPIGIGRRTLRADCDAEWLARGGQIFRLPGIYGPGRNPLERIRSGKAHRIDLTEQVFSRVYVSDIASGVLAAISQNAPAGAYNLGDDMPCSQNAVIEEGCRLIGQKLPPLQSLDEADLSEMARGFYVENRRVANGKAKRLLGWKPAFPTYREGLRSLL